jgi:DNA-binding GntR family transcriptional regulator
MATRTDKTLTQQLAIEIADAVLSGEFASGQKLDEQMLAQRFNVSRTPVREALRHVASSGLVEIRPRRGAAVASVDKNDLEMLFVAMGELEAACARLAALSMTPIERRRLNALHDKMADYVTGDLPEAFAESNLDFHTQIYAGTHNRALAEMTAGLRRRLAPYRRAQFRTPGRLPRSHAEHGAIVAAILAGHAAEAHASMLHHMTLVESAFEEFSMAGAA